MTLTVPGGLESPLAEILIDHCCVRGLRLALHDIQLHHVPSKN